MALRQQMVARLVGVNAVSAAQLARESGIKQQNLSRWLAQARGLPCASLPANGVIRIWTVEQKARIVGEAAQLSGADLIAYLGQEGVKLGNFRCWRLALEEAGEESVGAAKRIRQLERELDRKERALAELATLLVLREATEEHMLEAASAPVHASGALV